MKKVIPYIRSLIESLADSRLTAQKCIDRAYAKIELQDYKGAIAAYTKSIEIAVSPPFRDNSPMPFFAA